jgi:hypothetical protein
MRETPKCARLSPKTLYMAVVTLLILSNDAAVCDALHRIKVRMLLRVQRALLTVGQIKEVLWFKERRLLDISVGR